MPSLGGLVRDITAITRAIPGVRFAERQLRGVERVALRELSARIEEAAPPPPSEHNGHRPTPPERLEALLRRSMHQTPDESNASLVEVVLQSIVPDEARIISALSDGSTYPVVHVTSRGEQVLANASSVGRAAGVALPDRVPAYLTHLLALGMVQIGPEDKSIPDEYEILLTDQTIRRVRRDKVRFVKRTVQISDVGREFWQACR
jgi:hypothetical protein